MLDVGALPVDGEQFGFRGVQFRLRARDIEFACRAAFESRVPQVKRVSPKAQRIAQNGAFGVERAQGEVVLRHVGLQDEQRVFKRGEAGLGVGVRPLKRTPDASPQVQLVGQIERHAEVVAKLVWHRIQRVVRGAAARRGRTGIEYRKKFRLRIAGERPRLGHARHGRLQVLVVRCCLAFEIIQHRIVEHAPPIAPRDGVGGRGLLPLAGLNVGEIGRSGRCGPAVIRPHGHSSK